MTDAMHDGGSGIIAEPRNAKKTKPAPAARKRRNYVAELQTAERRIQTAAFCLGRARTATSQEAKADFVEAAIAALNGTAI